MDAPARYYFRIDTSDEILYVWADSYKIEEGNLNMYTEKRGIVMSFRAHVWDYITPASIIDGSTPYVEHKDKKEHEEY